ncbi:phosphatase PAP2 family protein [Cellulomonas sp. NPDC057328]|uniref:phosphatase PAP2 family protein n=1 Tax=Cellulomonas sp. NPDC057328 TaxID=3346101 RepID=UPI00362FC941
MSRAAGVCAVLALPVAALALVVRTGSSALHVLDERAVAAATDVTRSAPVLHDALVVWQEVTQPGWLVLAGAGVCLWVARRRGLPSRALWGVLTLLASWGTSTAVKLLVQRARPVLEDPLAHASGFSFPSGHAAGAVAAGAVLTVVGWPLLGRRARVAVPAAAALVVVLTAADRVLLGVHHPSDVVAGAALAGAVVAGSWAGWAPDDPGTREDDRPAPRGRARGRAR